MANRIFGLSGSGMDIDSMVKSMMQGSQNKYDSAFKKKTKMEWKKAEYNTMYTSVSEFRNTVFSNKLQANLSPRKVSSTNTAAVTATSTADSANVTHSIEVTQLANGVQESSSSTITSGSAKDTLVNQFGMSAGNFSLQITNGTSTATVSVDTTKSIYDVVSSINKAGIGVVANYDANMDRFFLSTASSGSSASIDFSGSSASGLDFITNKLKLAKPLSISDSLTGASPVGVTLGSINGFTGGNLVMKNGSATATIAVAATDSVTDLMNKINSAADINAVASIDANGVFSIKAKSGTVDLSSSAANVLSMLTGDLKLPNGSSQLNAIGAAGVTGSAAVTAADSTKKLSSLFGNLAGKGTLAINDGTTTKNVTIDFASDTIDSIISKINGSGANIAASYSAFTRQVTIGGTNGATINLAGTDKVVSDFLTQKLQLTDPVNTPFTTNTSAGALFADPAKTSLASQFGLVAGGTYTFKLTNGTNITNISVNTSTDTLQSFIDKINNSGMQATASYNYTTRKVTISAAGSLSFVGSDNAALTFLGSKLGFSSVSGIDATGISSSNPIFNSESSQVVTDQFTGITGGRFDLKVTNNGHTGTVSIDTDNDSIDGIIAKLNAAKDGSGNSLNINASYANGKFTMGTTDHSSLDFSGSDSAALAFLGNNLKLNANISQHGKDALIKIDGIDATESSNVFTVAGVTYTLNGLTNGGASGNAASIVVTSDIDKTIENVKKFVEAYNTMLTKLNTELKQDVYKSYQPLTDDEKKSLTDDQIKQWEEKAKSGLLNGDTTLSALVDKMRNNFTDAVIGVGGSYKTATSIGIDTSLGTYKEGGKLYVDEAKLRSALNADPNAAYKVLGTDGSLLTGNQKGVMARLYDSLTTSITNITREAGLSASATYDTTSTLGKQINAYTKQMKNMKTNMSNEQERYYKRLTAMETALNKMQSQSANLAKLGG